MRNKLILALVIISLVLIGNATKAKNTTKSSSVGYIVNGFVKLTRGQGPITKDIYDVYVGSYNAVPAVRYISVVGAYVPGYNFVRVYEDNALSSEKFFFDIPVPPEAFSNTTEKGTFKRSNTIVTAYYTTESQLLANGLDDETNNSIHRIYKKNYIKPPKSKNPIKKFKKKLHKIAVNKFKTGITKSLVDFGAVMSVNKVVASKNTPDRGAISGKFYREGSPATGRFFLSFNVKKNTVPIDDLGPVTNGAPPLIEVEVPEKDKKK